MIRKDHGSSFVAIVEYLRFHTVQAKSDGLFIRRNRICKDRLNVLFDYTFYRQRRNIARTARLLQALREYVSVLIKAFVYQLGDMAKDRIVGRVADNILIQNKLPCVL